MNVRRASIFLTPRSLKCANLIYTEMNGNVLVIQSQKFVLFTLVFQDDGGPETTPFA